MSYYDGTKLLSLKDLDGETPEIFLCSTNRSGGKTTYFSHLIHNRFVKLNQKYMLLYRFSYELDSVSEKFFKDIGVLFYPNVKYTEKERANGTYIELFADGVSCGYAVDLNHADQIKKMSHLFSDTANMFMDEFQSETNKYCTNEIKKFRSVHTSVARGRGQQCRYVPVYMASNPVTLLNPYYTAFNISSRLTSETKFLRGNGFVVEQGYVEDAALAQKASGFNKAFGEDEYADYCIEGKYLDDNYAFIDKPLGNGKYLATIKYNGVNYAVREYADLGIIYCDDRADATFPIKISVTTEDHNINYVMLKKSDFFLSNLRWYFERGCFRFKDLRCKSAILKALSY